MINVLFFSDTVGSQLENPCQDQRGNETNGENDDDQADRRIPEAESGKNGLHHLDDEPGGDDIGGRDA